MGNVTIKEGGDVEVDEKNIYLSSLATESENLSSSVISEDAISLTTDSTATTTEYESANENDNCSNRVSTNTDIWYDFSSSVKSLVNEATNLEDLSVDNSSSEVSRLINGICENSSSGFVAVPECCGDSLPEWRSSPKQETFHDLSNFLQDAGSNLVVRAKSSNDDEFVKENYCLIRNWHQRTRNAGDMKNRSERVKKTTKTKPARRKRSCRQHRFRRGWKLNGDESTIPSKEENEFDEMADALAKALDQVSIIMETPAVAKTYDYEIITSLVNNSFDGNSMVLWNLEIINFLNDRLVYSAVFQFSYDNVYVFCDDDTGNSQKLRETFVRSFLSQDSYYENLNLVVFRMKCQLKRLHYMVEIPRENMLQGLDEFFVKPKIDFGGFSTNKNFVKKIASNSSSHDSPSSGVQRHRQQFNNEHPTKPIMNCSKENISEAGPATAADIDNINNVPFLNDSSELDFISKAGGTGLVAETLRKQSLYVKFDPLVAQEVNSTLNDNTLKLDDSSIANNTLIAAVNNVKLEPSQVNNTSAEVTNDSSKLNTSVGQLISVTPSKSPRRSTPKSSPRYADTDPDDVSKLQSLLLKQMKKEESFKEEIESLKLENEQVLKKLQNSEQEISNLKSVLEAVQENEKKLKNELMERIKSKQQLSLIMEEYEKTMSQMVSKRDDEKKEFDAMIKKIESERDNTLQHLNNLENAFNDIHQKYERGKAVNEALKKNEDLLKKSLNEYEQTVKTVENKYELLKSHATSQLEKANQELELITQSYEKEQAKMKAMLKKSEIQINSLQNALERKSKENQELTAICDELIVKLSTHSNS